MNRSDPTLIIDVTPRGVARLVVEYDRGEKVHGMSLLHRVLPALEVLESYLAEATPKAAAFRPARSGDGQ